MIHKTWKTSRLGNVPYRTLFYVVAILVQVLIGTFE